MWDMTPVPWTSHSLKYHYYTLWNNCNSKGATTMHADYLWLAHLPLGNEWVMNTAWLESCIGPVSQQTHALHVFPNTHIPLKAPCSHTHSNLACILQEIITKVSSFIEINSLLWHAINHFWASSKCIHCSQQHIDPMSRVLLEKLTTAWAETCMIWSYSGHER